jgi:hypothetical protein
VVKALNQRLLKNRSRLDELVLYALEKEVDRRIVDGSSVHNEDLVYFLMADMRMPEELARTYVEVYCDCFSEEVKDI